MVEAYVLRSPGIESIFCSSSERPSGWLLMSLRKKIIKLAVENPGLREDLLGVLSPQEDIQNVIRKLEEGGGSNVQLLKDMVLSLAEKSYARGKSEAPPPVQPQVQVQQAPGNVIRIEVPIPTAAPAPPTPNVVSPALPMKPLSEQTNIDFLSPSSSSSSFSPAPSMPTEIGPDPPRPSSKPQNLTDLIPGSPSPSQVPQNFPNPSFQNPGGGVEGSPTFMPSDQRQLHEILERFKTLNNVDKDRLTQVMQNVLNQMPDNNLRRRLHSYMETAKHELL